MQIVIDIPEERYKHIMRMQFYTPRGSLIEEMLTTIRNGTPLPKGHRGIVDLKNVQWAFDDAILEEAQRTGQVRATHNEIVNILGTVPTIIEADKAESEEV